MRLAAEDQLKAAGAGVDRLEAGEIVEHQIGALPDGRAAGEADGEDIRIHSGAGGLVHVLEQLRLGAPMRVPDFALGHAEHVAQTGIVLPPIGNVPVEHRLHGRRGPGRGVHAVGDRIDLVLREHRPGDLAVSFGHAVHVLAVVEREIRHVQHVVQAELPRALVERVVVTGDDAGHQRQRELVVSGGHRRMRREHAQRLDGLHGLAADRFLAALARFLERELDGEQRGVAFVHVKASQIAVAERAQHADAADAEDHFLAQAVARVAAVEMVGQAAIFRRIRRQVGIEQQDRDDVTGDAAHVVSPRAQVDTAMLDLDADPRRKLGERLRDRPVELLLGLIAALVQLLPEIAFAMQQGHGHQRQRNVRRRAKGIAGQNAKAAGIGRDRVFEAHFHREVGDGGLGLGSGIVDSRNCSHSAFIAPRYRGRAHSGSKPYRPRYG